MVDLINGGRARVKNPNKVVRMSAPGLVKSIWLKEGPQGPPGQDGADGADGAPGGVTSINGRVGVVNLDDVYAALAHTHNLADINATGTPDATTFLRGDGTWSPPSGGGPTILTAYKPADTARTSTSTLTDDPDLSVSVAAGGVYAFEVTAMYTANTTEDMKFSWTAPSGSTGWQQALRMGATSTGTSDPLTEAQLVAVGSLSGSSIPAGGRNASKIALNIRGSLIVGATSGTFAFMWAQNSSGGNATTLYAGSWIRLQKLN